MRITVLAMAICLILLTGCASEKGIVTIGFWNVENLFDLVDDPEKNDEEFAIGGRKNMTPEILDLKLDHMSIILSDLDADILGLCEVENRDVLDSLNIRFVKRNYSIIHFDSPDERGIDNALLYDANVFSVADSRAIPIQFENDRSTRDILYVHGFIKQKDIHLFVNHWPSNYNGVEQAIPRRIKTANILRTWVDELLAKDPGAEIIIMGDLNENPGDTAVGSILKSSIDRDLITSGDGSILWNGMGKFIGVENGGTYKYRGEDNILDHIIVSQGILDNKNISKVAGSIRINYKPAYRQQEGPYAGYPFRFWAGDSLLGGYSDHLAVSIQLRIKN
jgi:predicted extracellular nuclease